MTNEEHRELQVLSDAEGPPKVAKVYHCSDERELAATATRLARETLPHMLEVAEKLSSQGPVLLLRTTHEAGRARLHELRLKHAAELH
jgi:hypothetical protein